MVHLRDRWRGGNALISLRSTVKQDDDDASRAGCCERAQHSVLGFHDPLTIA